MGKQANTLGQNVAKNSPQISLPRPTEQISLEKSYKDTNISSRTNISNASITRGFPTLQAWGVSSEKNAMSRNDLLCFPLSSGCEIVFDITQRF